MIKPTSSKKIAFIIPNARIGGGNSVMIAYADRAAASGHEVTIVVSGESDRRPELATRNVPILSMAQISDAGYDVAIASWWEDIAILSDIRARHHVLFLQRLEDRIYEDSDVVNIVRSAFLVPIPGITISHHLRNAFQSEYGRELPVVYDGIDKSTFNQSGTAFAPRHTAGLRVLVEGPLGVWHKNVVPALRIARLVADETWLLTSTKVRSISGVDRVFSRVAPSEAAAVYRSCDVLLKLSSVEGLGLPALEMFHCGGTVVAFDAPPVTEYAEHGRNALLAPTNDFDSACRLLAMLKADPQLLERLKSEAIKTALQWPSEHEAGTQFLDTLTSVLSEQPPTSLRLRNDLAMLRGHSRPPARTIFRDLLRDNELMRYMRHSLQVRMPGRDVSGYHVARSLTSQGSDAGS